MTTIQRRQAKGNVDMLYESVIKSTDAISGDESDTLMVFKES